MIYANPESQSRATPLSIAEDLEQNVFPDILNQFPTSVLTFKGEIEDTRESQGEFSNSILIAVILIYGIIAVMFNSLLKPLLVLSVVPFGVVGVIATFYFHGMLIYGFFATIGALGMIGVVVNDAIIMIDRIYKELINNDDEFYQAIADTAATRLRPILVTTITTVVGILPTAYGFAGYDSMLAEMMLAMGWGLVFGTMITLVLIPVLISVFTPKSKNSLN
jgi:multidrug efflux pump subunit AcrB